MSAVAAVSVGDWLEELPTEEFIPWLLNRFGHQRLVLTTGFGMEGCVLIDLFAKTDAEITVAYLDTQFLFAETYRLQERLAARYPRLRFVRQTPQLTPEDQARQHGPELWTRDPDRCCDIRKKAPMLDVLNDVDVWITAITRSQTSNRATTPLIGWDGQFGVVKVAPLARWDRQRVWEYIDRHDVPFNPLHLRGYPTIGCTHCTSPVADHDVTRYSRAGRWVGTDKTECGLHGPTTVTEEPGT